LSRWPSPVNWLCSAFSPPSGINLHSFNFSFVGAASGRRQRQRDGSNWFKYLSRRSRRFFGDVPIVELLSPTAPHLQKGFL
jgi:hypothetical protein